MCARLVLCFLLTTSLSIWATETSLLSLKSQVHKGTIYEPQGLWPFLGASLGVMDSSEQVRSGGMPLQVKALGSYYFDGIPWVADAGLGLHSEWLTQDGPGSDAVFSFYTELAARYQFSNRWQLGAIWNTLVDNPHRYQSNNGAFASFIGLQVMKEFVWSDDYLLRAGCRGMTDVGLRGETINTFMADLEMSFGSSPRSAALPKRQEPPASPMIKAPVAPQVAHPSISTFFVDGRELQFESESTKLTEISHENVRRLARNLAMNRELFDKIEIAGHTDPRGEEAYNQSLSLHRASAVANTLTAAGISQSQIVVIGKGSSEPLTQSREANAQARNRRVEIQFTGVQDTSALKNLVESSFR